MRTTKILSVSLPPKMFTTLKTVAKREEKTQSELFREALRRYLEWTEFKSLQKDMALRAQKMGIQNEYDIEKLIDEVRK